MSLGACMGADLRVSLWSQGVSAWKDREITPRSIVWVSCKFGRPVSFRSRRSTPSDVQGALVYCERLKLK